MTTEQPDPFASFAEDAAQPAGVPLKGKEKEAFLRQELAATRDYIHLTANGRNRQLPDGRKESFIQIPMPPSMNNIWATVGDKRVRTEAYEKWITEAGWILRTQQIIRYEKPVVVNIRIERTSPIADLDNRIKPVLDLLQKMNVLANDNLVLDLRICWFPTKGGCKVHIVEATERDIENARLSERRPVDSTRPGSKERQRRVRVDRVIQRGGIIIEQPE